ncbi:MAG: hypothetical protein V3V04_07420 [Rhizobiaceae bacterium]
MELPITSTIAACLALIGLALTIQVSARRGIIGMKFGISRWFQLIDATL